MPEYYNNLKVGDKLIGRGPLADMSCIILCDHGNGCYGALFGDGSGSTNSMIHFDISYWVIEEKREKPKTKLQNWFKRLDNL